MSCSHYQSSGNTRFYRAAALCSLLSAITTCLLIMIPVQSPPDFLQQAALSTNTTYLFRSWVYFFHPMFALVSVIGLFLTQFQKNPGTAITALIFFIFWALTEALQQAFNLDALNNYWRPMLLNATDSETRITATHLLTAFNGIYDSFYFLLLFSFGIGSLLMGSLMIKGKRLQFIIAVSMIYFGVLSLISFITYYGPWPEASNFIAWNYQWIYASAQPLTRLLIAWYLWQYSFESQKSMKKTH